MNSVRQLLTVILTLAALNADDLSLIKSQLSNNDTLKRGTWSLYAKYVDSGEEVFSFHPDQLVAPASGLKIIPTGMALYYLGPDFRFSTDLAITGTVTRRGTLKGNLLIIGRGDPTLGSETVPGSIGLDSLMGLWTAAVVEAGIRRIKGDVIVVNGYLNGQALPDDWVWSDMGNYYGASGGSLVINDNLYHLTFKPGKQAGVPAEILGISPSIPGLSFTNHMRTGREGSGDQGYIYCAPRQFKAQLRGTVPAGYDEFTIKGSIPDPPRFCAQTLIARLEEQGVRADGAWQVMDTLSAAGQKVLITVQSPPLIEITKLVNRRSINLYTEQLMRVTAREISGDGSYEGGIAMIEQFLDTLGVDHFGMRLNDGSGLSRTNQVSARQFVDFLAAMKGQPVFAPFYRTLSIAGDPEGIGFVKSFGAGTELAHNARIKTGSIGGVRSHSGYLNDSQGRLISFSLICNNYAISTRRLNKIHEVILINLANK